MLWASKFLNLALAPPLVQIGHIRLCVVLNAHTRLSH